MKILIWPILFLVCFALSASAQTAADMQNARQAEVDAVKAYQSKAFLEFLANIKLANTARPNHPRIIYNLASAYAVNGQADPALDALDRLARMGLFFDIQKDNDFGSLRSNQRFAAISEKMEANRRLVNASSKAFLIPDKTLISESVAYDPNSRRFFVGSVHQRKIVAIDKSGRIKDLSTEKDGLWSVLGMKVDAKRNVLWACSSALPQMRGYATGLKGRSGIFKYDLKTGKLIRSYILPDAGHALGDLVVTPDGTVYATDSTSPVIYKIDAKGNRLEEFLRSDNFVSLQGLTIGNDRNDLFVADYSKGIFQIDIAKKAIVQIMPAADITLLGIDGLYYYRGSLIAIQNGVTPQRVIVLSVKGNRIIRSKTLEANHADFMEPTLGTLVDDDFYYIANSQWPLVNEKAELSTEKLMPTSVLKLNLKRGMLK